MYILAHDSNHPPHPPPSTLMSLYTQFLECSRMDLIFSAFEGFEIMIRNLVDFGYL